MISRRDLLKAAGATVAGAAATSEAGGLVRDGLERPHDLEGRDGSERPPDLERRDGSERRDFSPGDHQPSLPLEALTADEADLLTAIATRLIPADAIGPGAVEAGAIAYLDRALAGALAPQREAYRRGLAALERYARSSRGRPFRELATVDQDSLLIDLETGSATGSGAGFDGSSAAFFAMMKGHIWQGTFGDPFYGGNRGYIGWELLGYPGVRTVVTADDQRLGAVPTPLRRSAYDGDLFHKATASSAPPPSGSHGHDT